MGDKMFSKEKTALQWAEEACRNLMSHYEPVKHYHQGVFLCGMHDVWQVTKEEEYYFYFKEYVDKLVDEEGNFLFRRSELDAIQPELLLFPLYKRTGLEKYKTAATKLRNLLKIKSNEGRWFLA